MDERTLLKLRRMEQAGEMTSPMRAPVTVHLALADSEDAFDLRGTMDFQDNQVDPATGTMRMRAIVDNSKGLLSPGLFMRVRYPIRENTDELLVPEESLGSDQGQPFVYVIDKKNQVVFKRVELGPQVGTQRVIREGVDKNDRVVVTGLQRIRRGATVAPELRTSKVETAEAPATTKTAHAKTAKNDGKAAE
jgi:multidrug efflux system membrane fusion protein